MQSKQPLLCCTAKSSSSLHLAAHGSLSMLPDASNWGPRYHDTLAVQVTRCYSYCAVVAAWIPPSLYVQDVQQPFPGTQPSLGRADSQPSLEHTTISSLHCYSPSLHMVTLLLPALQTCPLCIYESVHTRVPLRHSFCAAREVAFSLFSSPPQAVCALVSGS